MFLSPGSDPQGVSSPRPARRFAILSDRIAKLDVTGPLALECSFPGFNFYAALDTKYLGFFLVNVCLLAVERFRRWRAAQANQDAADEADRIRYLTIAINYLGYASICFTTFQAIPCDRFDDGTSWLRADRSIDCTSGAYYFHFGLAILGVIVFVVGIPATFLYALWKREEANPATGREKGVFNPLDFLSARCVARVVALLRRARSLLSSPSRIASRLRPTGSTRP